MGCAHRQVSLPSCFRTLARSPLPATSRLDGTVIFMSKVALSRGVLLLGNHVIAPTGSLSTTTPPSAVGIHPSLAPSGSMCVTGFPWYLIVAEKRPSNTFDGLMINLLSRLEKSAVCPLTFTESTMSPSRSSENDLNGFFVLAVRVVFALISPEVW